MNHLTDEQLQDYLDGNTAENSPVAVHLNSCPICQQALENYRAIFNELAIEPDFHLSDSFAENIITALAEDGPATIENHSPAVVRESVVVWAIASAMLLFGFFFIDFSSVLGILTGWMHQPYIGNFNAVKDYLSGFGNLPTMVALTAIGLGLLGMIDKVISHYKGNGLRSFLI